jgi:mono/diheme cytochrome c family protein
MLRPICPSPAQSPPSEGVRAVLLALSGPAAALAAAALCAACNPAETAAPPATPAAPARSAEVAHRAVLVTPAAPPSGPDDARGGRLYDDWRAEKGLTERFVPDRSTTRALDGSGGPNANGTLDNGNGKPIPNTGHDYRLKNLFGWDLRGAEGIYGSTFQRKSYVLPRNLLTDTRSADELEAWLAHGDAVMPAFGEVLDQTDLDDLVAYLVKTREGQLARPASIFNLDARAPKHYVLAPGGDPGRGRERYAISCADCHGDDGRNMTIDDTQSLGTLSRSSAYEVWFKMLNGQPGTDMRRQILDQGGAEQERAILDVLAALCDRTLFPPMAGAKDVRDGDPRCASYLR